MKLNRAVISLLTKIGLTILLCLVIIFLLHSNYRNRLGKEITLKSQYTFNVRIDEQGNVLDKITEVCEHEVYEEFNALAINKIGDIWIQEFTKQFTQRYVPLSKAIKGVKYSDTQILDSSTNTVLISFSAALRSSTSEYFQSWDGVLDDGRMYFEWVVTFMLDNHYDGTATVYVQNILTPEEYGIEQYNESLKDSVSANQESATKAQDNSLLRYEIKNSTLLVTYDGGEKYITVPVDCAKLPIQADSTNKLSEGSYTMTTYKTAFLYGGRTVENTKIPVTLTYSNDRGNNWVTSEIDQIYDTDCCYVEFFDENRGVIVIGYGKNGNQQSSKIYSTQNAGETWELVGSGPSANVLKGVIYIQEEIGFFVYDYVDGMDSNIYMTRDGGKTFSKVVLEQQELDSTAANAQSTTVSAETNTAAGTKPEEETTAAKLTWKDVYKEALVPVYDSDGIITIYLTQGSNGVYNSGKTAAKYQSFDGGVNWKYIGQLELVTDQ